MPQILVALIAGAGMYAASRLVAKTLEASAERKRAENSNRRQSENSRVPKDLGTLEWDAAAGVYRPRHR